MRGEKMFPFSQHIFLNCSNFLPRACVAYVFKNKTKQNNNFYKGKMFTTQRQIQMVEYKNGLRAVVMSLGKPAPGWTGME